MDRSPRLGAGKRAEARAAAPAGVVFGKGDATPFAYQRLREPERGELASDAVLTVEQIGVVNAIVFERSAERRDGSLLRED